MVSVSAMLLADARFPAGGHAHSGGLEPAATAGTVTNLASLEVFLRGRLRTTGMVAAGLAAAACARVQVPEDGDAAGHHGPAGLKQTWDELDAEADARTPSPAQREASRRQGRALLRAARTSWPDASWPPQAAPHHAVMLGAAAAAAGCSPDEAARIAAYQSVTGPASAAVRLLALDPMRATAVLAGLAADIDDTAARAAACAEGPLANLPYPTAPALDLLAEAHIRAEVRLFES
jgi:urease accessory protein